MLVRISAVFAALCIAILGFAPGASASGGHDYPGHGDWNGHGYHCNPFDLNFMAGTTGDDRLVGTNGDDVIAARGGNDRVIGQECNDILRGGFGNDRINGVDHFVDRIAGGRGTDVCVGNFEDSFTNCEIVIIRSPFPDTGVWN
jgi:Ca2+-binding RTX toxin-like protein